MNYPIYIRWLYNGEWRYGQPIGWHRTNLLLIKKGYLGVTWPHKDVKEISEEEYLAAQVMES